MSLLLLFGQAAAVTYTKTGAVAAGTKVAGGDVFESTETGAVTAATRLVGADAFAATGNGSVFAGTRLAGSVQAGFISKLGIAAAGATTSGADVFIASRTGAVAAATWGTGGDAATLARTGAVKASAKLTGFTRGLPGPTGKFVLTNARVVIAGLDVSRLCHQVSVELEREPIDITPFGATYREYLPGPTTGTFTIGLFHDPQAQPPSFWASLNDAVMIEVTPRNLPAAPENPTWTATAIAVRKTSLTGSVGDSAKAALELRSSTEVLELVS